MARYVMQRLLAMLLTLFIIVTVAFLVIRLMPSSIYDDPTISAEVLDMSRQNTIWIGRSLSSTEFL